MARPFSVFGAIPIDAPPTRTLCHGWSEPGAEVKPYQPKFCTAPGPSGPEGMKSGTVFCALELLRKGVGVSPVNGGPGEERLWAGTPIGARLRRRFASFADAAKEVAPQGETCEAWRAESSRPTSVMVREGRAGQETRPYGVSGGSQQDRGMGRNAPAGRTPQQEQETGRPRAAGF